MDLEEKEIKQIWNQTDQQKKMKSELKNSFI